MCLSRGCLVDCHLALALLFWANISLRIFGILLGLVDLLGLDEDSETALWMLFVSLRAVTSISCVFFSGIFRIVLLSRITLNFVQDMGPLAKLGLTLVGVVVFKESNTAV